MKRRLVFALSAAALALAACGPGAGGKDRPAGSNPAVPAPDKARASKVNGLDKDGNPIDAVAAAEMPAEQLPPIDGAVAPKDAQ